MHIMERWRERKAEHAMESDGLEGEECGLNKVDVQDRVKWRRLVWEHTSLPIIRG